MPVARLPFPKVDSEPLYNLLRKLHLLHARAGWPSTRELARGQSFSHTAVHQMFTSATQEPRFPVLYAVVSELARRAPLSDEIGLLDEFDELWSAAALHEIRAPQKVPEERGNSADALHDEEQIANSVVASSNMSPVKRIGSMLQTVKARKNLSIRELADRSSHSPEAVAAFVNGDTLPWTQTSMEQLMDGLNMTSDERGAVLEVFQQAKKLR